MREGFSPPKVQLSVISSQGGLGDMIARLPAVKYLVESFAHIDLRVYWPDYFLELARYLLPESPRLIHARLSSAPYALAKPYIEFDSARLSTLNLHLTKHAFLMLMDLDPPTTESMRYPCAPRTLMPPALQPYITHTGVCPEMVIVTTGYTSETRKWPSAHVNELARRLREARLSADGSIVSKGHPDWPTSKLSAGLTPVLLGTTEAIATGDNGTIDGKIDNDIDRSLFLDLTNKTTLVEALGIMQRAQAVVGVDNGLLHLAHCTDVPVVYGLTSLLSEHRIPFRRPMRFAQTEHGLTEILEPLVPCGGCQSRGSFINHDWRTCLFSDYSCTLTLTAKRFLDKLKALGVV